MRKKTNETGSFKSRSNEERPSRPSSDRKPAAKRSYGTDSKRSFGKKSETGSGFDKRKTFNKDSAQERRTGGSFNADKPFKKSFRKDDSTQEGGEIRKSNFRRDDKPSDFKKRPSTFRKRNEGESDKPFKSDKPYKSDRPFKSGKPYNSDKPFNSDKSFKSDRPRPAKSGKPFQSDKPYKSDKPYNSDKPYKSDRPYNSDKSYKTDKPYQSDRPFKKVYRKDETSGTSEGSFKRRTNSFDKRSQSGDKPVKTFGKRKPFSKDVSFEEIKPDRRRNESGSEEKPFRKTNRTNERSQRPFIKKPSDKQDETGAYAFEGKKQTPPEYNLNSYEKKGRGRSKSKTQEVEIIEEGVIRLNRYIANAGICSRREADVLIEAGEIKVNGNVVNELGYKIQPGDVVKYGTRTLSREKMMYVLLNKPKDYITTTEDPEDRKTVMELVANAGQARIYPIGRLDRNTTGLLILTNDGELAEKLSHPSNEIQKLYEVEIDRPITPEDYQAIIDGVTLEDGPAKVDDLAIVSPDRKFIGIALHSGRNRIVRRIFEHLGYKVVKLDRTVYAGLTKKDLPRGHWRYLSEKEVVRLKYFI